jgi:hypothetical protein
MIVNGNFYRYGHGKFEVTIPILINDVVTTAEDV